VAEPKVRAVEVDGFKVNVVMSDGTSYPFRTHTQAAKLVALSMEMAASIREASFLLAKATDGFKSPEEQDRITAEALGELRAVLAKTVPVVEHG
jgi:hypothetical protein